MAFVFALGAWNWRRQRHTLGSDEAAFAIQRSAATELTFAGIVLVLTAVLVSLPAPRAPDRNAPAGVQTPGRAP